MHHNDGYMISFSAKDPSIGLDLDLGTLIDNIITVDGLACYKNSMGKATPVRIMYSGDVDGDLDVDLADAILSLRILTGAVLSQNYGEDADVNEDGQIGIGEVIYILQKAAGLR